MERMEFNERVWHHVDGKPNERTWRAFLRGDGALIVEGLDDAHGVSDHVVLTRSGAYVLCDLQKPTTQLPSFMSWLQPVKDLRDRAIMFGLPVPEDRILVHSSRLELLVELKYLPPKSIEQAPGNAYGAAHFFGIEVVWCKALDVYAAVI